MKAPVARTGFAERCAEVCPGFRAVAAVRRARKSELLAGEIDGAPVIAKRLLQPNVVWDWYFAREVAIYRRFVDEPPPFRVPRTHAAAEDVLVIERLPVALAKLRRPYAELTTATLDLVLAYVRRIGEWNRFLDDAKPPAHLPSKLRQRLLEDPTDATWIHTGIASCGDRGLIGEGTVEAALEALGAYPQTAPCHGDLLLRNAMERDGEVVLVDWECAGHHAADWDLALLWTQLADAGRSVVDAHVGGGARHAAFLALVMFALCREAVFLEAFRVPSEHLGSRRVHDELAEVARRLV